MFQKRIALAEEFLRDAEELLQNRRFRSAVSRCYYGIYHLCVALFERHGLKPSNFIGKSGRPMTVWEHSVITRRFFHEFITRRPLFQWQDGQLIRRLYADRITADYEVDARLPDTYVTDAMDRARELFERMRKAV